MHALATRRDPAEQYKEEVERRVSVYMAAGAEFDPFNGNNLSEAIGEYEKCDEHCKRMASFLQEGNDAGAGHYLRRLSVTYWTKQATRQAEIDIATEAAEGDERTKRAVPAGMHRLVAEMRGAA